MPGLAVCRRYAEQGQNIIAMFNADMIGYQEAGKPIVLGFMVRDSAAQRPPPRPNPPRDSTCSWVYESISIQVSNVLPSNRRRYQCTPQPSFGLAGRLFLCVLRSACACARLEVLLGTMDLQNRKSVLCCCL